MEVRAIEFDCREPQPAGPAGCRLAGWLNSRTGPVQILIRRPGRCHSTDSPTGGPPGRPRRRGAGPRRSARRVLPSARRRLGPAAAESTSSRRTLAAGCVGTGGSGCRRESRAGQGAGGPPPPWPRSGSTSGKTPRLCLATEWAPTRCALRPGNPEGSWLRLFYCSWLRRAADERARPHPARSRPPGRRRCPRLRVRSGATPRISASASASRMPAWVTWTSISS
jgi:hypothetical protein